MPAITRLSIPFALAAIATSVSAQDAMDTVMKDTHTVFFIAINIFLTLYFALLRFDRFAVVHGPEILTTTGIFGCFYGIAIALLHFDATNVSASVPQLLEGVKTAFWASVSGVGGSLVIRARHHLQRTPIRQVSGAPKAASLDDVVAATQALQRSLSGNEEGSLLTQLKLMRQEQGDQLQGLRASFDTFAKRMVEDGSKALIDALREVIADFNAQINEQFGDNFKQLNAAVEKLVVWQQQYKEELDILQSKQTLAAEQLGRAVDGITSVASKAEAFAIVAAKLDGLIRTIAQQHKDIEQSQQSLSVVLASMKDVAPQFSIKLDQLGDAMRTGVSKITGDVADVIRSLGTQTQGASAELKQLLTDTMRRNQSEVNGELTRSMESIRQAVVTLDRALQEELTKSLETLGRQLASLSEKFVSDYSPLTERLRDVVRIAAQGR